MESNKNEMQLKSRPLTGIQRPNWMTQEKRQTVIVVRDRSLSMQGNKAQDASAACRELIATLAHPVNKDGFDAAVMDFAHEVEIVHDLEKVTILHENLIPIKVVSRSFGTSLTVGLIGAYAMVDRDLSQHYSSKYLQPVVILLSDGRHNTGPDPYTAAFLLKVKAEVVTVAFGTDADEDLLRAIASTPQHFRRCETGCELRKFLGSVGTTLTTTLATGANVSEALARIRNDWPMKAKD